MFETLQQVRVLLLHHLPQVLDALLLALDALPHGAVAIRHLRLYHFL